MDMTLAHWAYLVGVVAIVVTMAYRKSVLVPALAATFAVTWAFTGNFADGLGSMFNASLVAAGELFNIFLIIAVVTALLTALQKLGSDVRMIQPFRRIMRSATASYVVLAAVTFVVSLFFWPTPAAALVGAILVPAAIRAGLPPLHAAVAITLAGQGMALASDYVIQVAPDISASAAGTETGAVTDKALILSLLTGAVALPLALYRGRRALRTPDAAWLEQWERGETLEAPGADGPGAGSAGGTAGGAAKAAGDPGDEPAGGTAADPDGSSVVVVTGATTVAGAHPRRHADGTPLTGPEARAGAVLDMAEAELRGYEQAEAAVDPHQERCSRIFAVLTPVAFLALVVYMTIAKFADSIPDVAGGDAAALVGGVAALLLVGASTASEGRLALDSVSERLVDGLVFAFKAMGVVLPIGGFFLLGSPEFAGAIMGLEEGAEAPALLLDLVERVYDVIPDVPLLTGIGMLLVGMLTGIDGTGFDGLPLTGALSGTLGATSDVDPSLLAAVGQMGAIWVGGGTLVAWSSMVAVAGVVRVPVLELARACLIPVVAGLLFSTVVGVLLLG